MIQPYSLGTSITAIDGGNIATGTLVATAIRANSITTNQMAAGSILAVNLAVGPNYQFTVGAGGIPMTLNTDGSFSLPASGNNINDGRWVVDGTRSYAAGQYVKTYAATFTNPNSVGFGIVLNVAAPWATSGSTGILLWLSGSTAYIYRVAGVGNYSSAITSQAVTLTGIDRLVVQYYGSQGSPRMRVFLNSVEIFAGWGTDANLGTSGGAQGGYAGFMLTNSSILVSQIIMGNQPTTIEDGAINTNMIQANAITAGKLTITGASGLIGAINAANGGSNTTSIDGGSITAGSLSVTKLAADIITAGQINTSLINVSGLITVVNGGSVTKITGSGIATGTISTANLNFTPVTGSAGALSSQVVASINASTEGIKISGAKIQIDGSVTFTSGYAPSDILTSASSTASGYASTAQTNAISSATTLASTAQSNSISTAAADATTKANSALSSAQTYASGQAAAALSSAQYYADNTSGPNAVATALANTNSLLNTYVYVPGTTQINGAFIQTGTLSASQITTGVLTSNGYSTYNTSSKTATGFALSNSSFLCWNVFGRQQSVQAEFGTNVMISGYPVGKSLLFMLNGFDATQAVDQLTSSTMLWYKGNCASRSGSWTPNIACLKVYSQSIFTLSSASETANWSYTITPTSYSTTSDNLDGLRYMRVRLYQYTTSTAPFADFDVQLTDRLYDGSTGATGGSFMWQWRTGRTYGTGMAAAPNVENGSNLYGGYMRCTLYNAYGASADVDFGPSTTDGGLMPTTTITGQTGSSGSSGSGGYTGCLPAGTPFQTLTGMLPIEQVVKGTSAFAYDDLTLQPVEAKVARVIVYHNRDMYRVTTDRGSIICSHDHRFTRMVGVLRADYPAARNLEPMDLVLVQGPHGPETAMVTKIESLGYQDTVYHVQLDNGHLFVAGGFLAHNMKGPGLL